MKERPILFSGPMVKAILAGRKTQTRRIVKPQPEPWTRFYLEGGCCSSDWRFELGSRQENATISNYGLWMHSTFHESEFIRCPYGQPGDRLWVRERWQLWHEIGNKQKPILCAYDDEDKSHKMHPDAPDGSYGWALQWVNMSPIFMPRWASRITLEVTGIRVERLQEISEGDARAEGFGVAFGPGMFSRAFDSYWDEINGAGSWQSNPWVWVVEFLRLEAGKNGRML